MDGMTLLSRLLSSQAPDLPLPAQTRAYLFLSWSLVLACAAVWATRRTVSPWRWSLPGLVVLWTLFAGAWSPAYWLGLALRAPSLSSTLLCAWWILRQFRPAVAVGRTDGLFAAGLAGIVLGWLLLLDTFAVLPGSLYALGFSPALLGLVALAAGWPWVMAKPQQATPVISHGLVAVLLAYVLLRLPSGNLWDALLDPCLWLFLQARWLVQIGRRLRGARASAQH